ncbi:cytochrome c oxidase assembly protein subunit 15 [Nocardiopsis algeriensis]|uniref:Cytochrome c oxidase assembly protein subunit 15 n=2 Tax=Nocardiopsis algeriensis TaxID=1478215 RepID=A0A841INS1_9ACTN|nr:cytochrome c oxidase assembly protein subunit 15 [Nocardiopsis algeriensis]
MTDLPPLAAEDIVLLGAPLWVWQVVAAVAGVLALVLLARSIWNPTPGSLRAWAAANIAVNAGIAVTGAVVRVTSSGLGCSEWPRCTPESFVPIDTGHSAFNAAIEFGNRTLTFIVLAVAVIVVVAVLRSRPRRRDLLRMALIVPIGVVGQAVVGGITVWSGLHPASVAAHFLLSMVMTFVTVALYVRCQEPEGKPRVTVAPMLHTVAVGLVVVGFLLLVAGTVVTGTGPHGGDAAAPRWDFAMVTVTRLHSALAWLTLAGSIGALVLALRTGAGRATRLSSVLLVAAVALQGLLGYVQYALALPEALAVLHVLGSALVWIAISRLYFSTTSLVPAGEEISGDPVGRAAERSPAEPSPGR